MISSVRVPREPQEVHSWYQDGLRRSQEAQGPKRPHHLPQERDQIDVPWPPECLLLLLSTRTFPNTKCFLKAPYLIFVPSGRHDRRTIGGGARSLRVFFLCKNMFCVLCKSDFDLLVLHGTGLGLSGTLEIQHSPLPTRIHACILINASSTRLDREICDCCQDGQ